MWVVLGLVKKGTLRLVERDGAGKADWYHDNILSDISRGCPGILRHASEIAKRSVALVLSAKRKNPGSLPRQNVSHPPHQRLAPREGNAPMRWVADCRP
jgi:hypothetical protein